MIFSSKQPKIALNPTFLHDDSYSGQAPCKASVRNHSKSVALYCAEQGYNIRCNSIHPGVILTPMWVAMLGEGVARKQAIKKVAADGPHTMGEVSDVAYALCI